MDRILSVEYCGDNIKNGTEECDGTDGVSTGQACSSTCTLEYCGNGKKEGPEECDGTDGVSTGQTCHATRCKLEYCGDNIKNGSEECDGTDTTAGQTCASDCTLVATTDTPAATDDIQVQLREPSIELTNDNVSDSTAAPDTTQIPINDDTLQVPTNDNTLQVPTDDNALDTTTDTTTDTTASTGTCGDGTIDQSLGEECDGTTGITDSTTQECSSECKIVAKTASFCTDGATPVTVFCYGTEMAAEGTNSGYCLDSAGDPAVEIKGFAAPRNFVPGLKALRLQDKNMIFRIDLATGETMRIFKGYTFTKITDLAKDSTGTLHVADSGKVLKATKEGVTDLGLSVTVVKLVLDRNDNKYLLTDDGKLYKADASDALTLLYDILAERAGFKAGGKMALFKGSLYLSDLTAGKVLQYSIAADTLSELADVTTPTGLAVRGSTGDLMVQDSTNSVIYKIAPAQAVAGQTVTPEVYMEKVKSTGMTEVKICPSVTIIERPTATSEVTDTTGTSEATDTAAAGETTETVDSVDDEGEGAAEVEGETIAATTDSAAESGEDENDGSDEGEELTDESGTEGIADTMEPGSSAIDECVQPDGSPSTLVAGDFSPPLTISRILAIQKGSSFTTYADGVEYAATWNRSTGKVDLKSVTTGETTTCEYLAEASAGVGAAGGGCLNMAGSAPITVSPASFIWLLFNFGVLIGIRRRADRLDRSVPPS